MTLPPCLREEGGELGCRRRDQACRLGDLVGEGPVGTVRVQGAHRLVEVAADALEVDVDAPQLVRVGHPDGFLAGKDRGLAHVRGRGHARVVRASLDLAPLRLSHTNIDMDGLCAPHGVPVVGDQGNPPLDENGAWDNSFRPQLPSGSVGLPSAAICRGKTPLD